MRFVVLDFSTKANETKTWKIKTEKKFTYARGLRNKSSEAKELVRVFQNATLNLITCSLRLEVKKKNSTKRLKLLELWFEYKLNSLNTF